MSQLQHGARHAGWARVTRYARLSPLLQPIKNIFFSPKKAALASSGAVAASPAQRAADAAADAGAGADDDDDESVSTMDSVDRHALDELEANNTVISRSFFYCYLIRFYFAFVLARIFYQ